jgi:hypothetical protein
MILVLCSVICHTQLSADYNKLVTMVGKSQDSKEQPSLWTLFTFYHNTPIAYQSQKARVFNRNGLTDWKTDRLIFRRTDWLTLRQTDRQAGRLKLRQTDRLNEWTLSVNPVYKVNPCMHLRCFLSKFLPCPPRQRTSRREKWKSRAWWDRRRPGGGAPVFRNLRWHGPSEHSRLCHHRQECGLY